MSPETVLMGLIFTVIAPVLLGLLGWVLRELVGLTKIVASLQVMVEDHHDRINHIEHIVTPHSAHRSVHPKEE